MLQFVQQNYPQEEQVEHLARLIVRTRLLLTLWQWRH